MTFSKSSQSVSTDCSRESISPNLSRQSSANEQDQKVPVFKGSLVIENYDFHEQLGKGAFGTVIRATRKSDNLPVAVKIIRNCPHAEREADLCSQLHHQYIAKLFEIYVSEDYIFLVQELCEERLAGLVGSLTTEDVLTIGRQLAEGLKYIHSQGVIHRDLKPDNLMINRVNGKLCVKIIDFGLSTRQDRQASISTAVGTNYFMAPEVITNQYSTQADMWSLGVVLLTLIKGTIPFVSQDPRELFQEIVNFRPELLRLDPQVPSILKAPLFELLQPNQTLRTTAPALLQLLEMVQGHSCE